AFAMVGKVLATPGTLSGRFQEPMRAAIRVRSPSRESVDGRQLEWDVRFEYLTDLDNRLLTRNLEFGLIDVEFESGDEFGLSARRGFERLIRPFAIHQGADGP